jgi:hypothetical protein
MTPGSIEDYLPFSTNGIAIASDGSIWLYHPPSPGGLVEVEPPVVPQPPVNTVPPTVTATTDLVVGSSLVSATGTWNPSGTLTRQWQRGGTVIAGSTGAGYVLQTADIGAMIGCPVTCTNQDGTLTVPSNTVGPIVGAAADPEPENLPTLRQSAEPPPPPPRSHHAPPKPHAKPPKRRY